MMRAVRFAVVVLCAGLAGCPSQRPKGPAKRVILLSCDTLRADRIGLVRNGASLTPNLDRLAAESAVFANAWSHAPLTGAALSALLTGRFPDEIGATPTNRELMPSEVETLAETVAAHGVETAAFVSNGVLRRPASSEGNIGLQQGFALFDDTMNSREKNRDLVERTGDACSDAVVSWLRSKSADDPFFLWVHYQDPHGPYAPPPAFLDRVGRADRTGEKALPFGTNNSGENQIPRYQIVPGQDRPGQYVERYDGEVAFFDAQVGRVLDVLRERGLFDDALVVFTADHGESLGEHGFWFCHGEHVHRDLVNVPLVVKAPRAAGARAIGKTNELAMHIDFAPTLLEAFGIASDQLLRGSSLLSAKLPDGRVAPQFLGPLTNPNRRLGVTDGRWRVIKVKQEPDRLYDLSVDPFETNDVAAANAGVVNDLGRRYVELMGKDKRPWLKPVTPTLDPGRKRVLEGLGYTDGDGSDDLHDH